MWYADGQLMRRGFTDHGVLQGKQVSWYDNGQMADRVFYVGGAPAGRWTHWYRDGKIASEREFRGGKPHGLERRWHRDGTLAYVARYRWGKLVSEKDYDHPPLPPEPEPSPPGSKASGPRPYFPLIDCVVTARAEARSWSLDAFDSAYRRCLRAAGKQEVAAGCHLAVRDGSALSRCVMETMGPDGPDAPQQVLCLALINRAHQRLDWRHYLELVGQHTFAGFCGRLPPLQKADLAKLALAHDQHGWLRRFAEIVAR